MINSEKLKSQAKACGFTQSELAAALGISQSALNLKINNRREMRLSEAWWLAFLLCIPDESIVDYFFVEEH